MTSHFTDDFFTANRKSLRRVIDPSVPLVMAANGLLQRGGDTSYPFCQDASFWYLTGCDEPDLVLVCNQDESYLIVPKREASRMAFDGSVDSDKLSKISRISLILDET
jgi:Xaa-Pro aminopeptidase